MATKTEVATKVLQKLEVLESGATADSADTDIVEDVYDSVYKILAAKDLVSWGSGDDIPTEAVVPVVAIVAEWSMTEFIVPDSVAQIVLMQSQKGEMALRAIEYNDYVPDEQQAHYF